MKIPLDITNQSALHQFGVIIQSNLKNAQPVAHNTFHLDIESVYTVVSDVKAFMTEHFLDQAKVIYRPSYEKACELAEELAITTAN